MSELREAARRTGPGAARAVLAGARAVLVAAAVGAWVLLLSVMAGQQPEDPAQGTARGEDPDVVARYAAAAEDSERPRDWYNYGTALLRDGRWNESRAPLRRAAEAEGEEVGRWGHYNLGLAAALAGREGGGEAEAGRERLLAAREAFREVLRRDPGDADARWNLELVERWLRESQQGAGGSAGGPSRAPSGGGGSGTPQGGAASGQPVELGPEEAAALLEAAGQAESAVRDRLLGQVRLRDPVVTRNW